MTIQDQYWIELYQLKVHINVIELVLENAEKWDRGLNIFLALTSSSSIAAWAIWSEVAWLWATFIALSHVIMAIKPFLRNNEIIKTYPALMADLVLIMNRFEHKWLAIAEGELTKSEINDERFNLRAEKSRILKKHIPTTIPASQDQHDKAEISVAQYFQTFFINGE